LLIYVGYLALRAFTEDEDQRARWSAAVGILGFLNVPIVYMSVRWWRTIHQVQSTPDTMDPYVRARAAAQCVRVPVPVHLPGGDALLHRRLERARAAVLEERADGREVHV
jgi:hypothetical protein